MIRIPAFLTCDGRDPESADGKCHATILGVLEMERQRRIVLADETTSKGWATKRVGDAMDPLVEEMGEELRVLCPKCVHADADARAAAFLKEHRP